MSAEAMRNAVEAMDKHDYEMADHILCQAIAEAESQPKREWFGLTPVEKASIWSLPQDQWIEATEKLLMEKNA